MSGTSDATNVPGVGRRNRTLGFDTRAIHHGYDPAEHSNAVQPPVFMTSTYGFPSVEANDAAAALGGKLYAREFNPTTEILEKRLASLEGAEAGLALASGMAAFGSLTLSLLSQGDELIVHRTLYSNVVSMLDEGLPRFGIKVVPVDLSEPENLDKVITPRSRMVHLETPVNPTADVLDIARIADRAHAAGLIVVVDSTFASPALQRPIEHGADIVLHSLTKYINGHGDVLGGALVGSAELIGKIHNSGLRYITGAVLPPLSATFILRGLKTLTLRMERHSSNALAIAQMLDAHPKVAWVRYPYLPTHPGYQIARKQMSGGSGIMSFGLRSGFEGARRLMNKLELATRAVSLGDAETLIMHPASIVEARKAVRPEAHLTSGVGEDLVRLSVGIEDVGDLLSDFEQALTYV